MLMLPEPRGKVTRSAEAFWELVWSHGLAYGAKNLNIWADPAYAGDYAQVIVVVLTCEPQ